MFSIDDSFDVDDETFLDVISKVKDKGPNTATSRSEPTSKRRSFEIGQPPSSTGNPAFSSTSIDRGGPCVTSNRNSGSLADPLGLNSSLLNRSSMMTVSNNNKPTMKSLEQGRISSEMVSRLGTGAGHHSTISSGTATFTASTAGMRNSFMHSVDSSTAPFQSSEPPQISTPNNSNRAKKFHFKASPKISPPTTTCMLSHTNVAAESTERNHSVPSRQDPFSMESKSDDVPMKQNNFLVPPKEKCDLIDEKVLFEISQDSWDGDLDLSLDKTPKWKPGLKSKLESMNQSKANVMSALPKPVGLLSDASHGNAPVTLNSGNSVLLEPTSKPGISQELFSPCDSNDSFHFEPRFASAQTPQSSKANNLPRQTERPGGIHDVGDSIFKTPVSTRPRVSLRSTMERSSSAGPSTSTHPQPESPLGSLHTPTSTRRSSALNMVSTDDSPTVETPSSTKSSAHKRKRKFPGPAGALPKLQPNMNPVEFEKLSESSPKVPLKQKMPVITDSQITCSQSSEEKFLDGPWQAMKDDLEPQAQDILHEFSIQNIIRKASKKLLPRGKVPVLCALIDQISIENAEASTVLKDPTGEMKGTVHRMVIKEHMMEMQPGTVLVLRQVGVFSPSSARNHYLNITPNNLVRLYTRCDETGVLTKNVAAFEQSDFKVPALPPSPVMNSSRLDRSSPGANSSGYRSPMMSVTPRLAGSNALFSNQTTPGSYPRNTGNAFASTRGMAPYANIQRTPTNVGSFAPRPCSNIQRTPSNVGSFVPRGPTNIRTPISQTITSMPKENPTPRTPVFVPKRPSQNVTHIGNINAITPQKPDHSNALFNTNTKPVQLSINNSSATATVVSHSTSNQPGATNRQTARSESLDNLWQNDQLDDLLDGLGDEMLADF